MPMGTRGNDPLKGQDKAHQEHQSELKPVDDPNVPMADLSDKDKETRLKRVRELDAFNNMEKR